ncbi:membrane protein [Streptomyces catenulae]|uniref:Ribosome associated membrane protein RAMP4 n=1 Tax=Streptomyces catenulae TaxID=66875 RepID=A0ABV2YTR5_9ACTN|nr:membrane protein [Streptomyces catenulae]
MMSATSTLALTHFVALADSFDKDKVTPGILGFIVFAVIGGAVWLLMKSMNRHMGKVDFEEKEAATASATGSTASAPKGEAEAG